MRKVSLSLVSTRRQLLAGTLALAGNAMCAEKEKKYAPRLVCNTYYWNQWFSIPRRYIFAKPDPLKAPPPARPADSGGMVWTEEQWNSVCSDLQYAGYRRMELTDTTFLGSPIEVIQAALHKYGVFVDHIWHSGPLYPSQVAEKTIASTIAMLDRAKPLESPCLFHDPFVDRGPLSDEDARTQNRGLDRIGREVKDRGMKLCVHNHQGPMRYGAKEWLGVVNNTDPALVSMCLDLDWTLQAGTDPFPLLYLAGDKGRLGAIHMRTQHKLIADQTMEDGGDIDFYKVADYLKKIQFDGVLVEETEPMKETKVTRTVRENKKLARIWCEKVFGVSAKA
jgi:sugar phosphate isomerase/epimerase